MARPLSLLPLLVLSALLLMPGLGAAAGAPLPAYCHAWGDEPTCTFRCDGAGPGWFNLVMVQGDGTGNYVGASMACGSSVAAALGSDVGMPSFTLMNNFLPGEGRCTLLRGVVATCGNTYQGYVLDWAARDLAQ